MTVFSLRNILVFGLLILVLIIGTGSYLWQQKEHYLNQSLLLEQDIDFTIQSGDSLKQVLNDLQSQGVMAQPYYLLFEARHQQQARLIKAGEYRIKAGTTPRQLLAQFIEGKVVQYAVTLVEGWNYRQLLDHILNHEQLVSTLHGKDAESIMTALGLEGTHPEGQFFPDTYHFPKGTTDLEFLQRAQQRMQAVLEEEWQQKADNLPYQSAYEALIMASIIEKETAVAEERAEIAGVFVRRLEQDMKLQTDPTVIYAIGETFDGDIRKKDLSIDSPYNTYVYQGLPPTPIAMVGREAIHAALHPANGKTLFFVSMGDGRHYFSETLEEHNRAVRKFILKK